MGGRKVVSKGRDRSRRRLGGTEPKGGGMVGAEEEECRKEERGRKMEENREREDEREDGR